MQISIHTSAREVTAPVPFLHWKKLISIHTSAREVTWLAKESPCSPSISIHTSAREVTVHSRYYRHYPVISIRPTIYSITLYSSASEVNYTWLNGRYRTAISIHTSAREVTCPWPGCIAWSDYFNPHFRKGSDCSDCSGILQLLYFNPHFRKGSDDAFPSQTTQKTSFQSTLPQGKWLHNANTDIKKAISIHTSAREVTDPIGYSPRSDRISIHTSAREVTGFGWFGFAERDRFQSTLPQGKWPGIP